MSEIYKLVQAIESYNESDLCLGTLRSLKKIKDAAAMLETELADKDKQLAEARAEIERKDKLIEQLKLALKTLRKYPHTYKMTGQSSIVVDKDIEQCNAALLAAERNEGL